MRICLRPFGPKGSPLGASGPAETTGRCTRPTSKRSANTTCTSRVSTTSGGSSSLDAPSADPTLWRLAWDGDDLAGFVIPVETDRGAVIDDLAVRKPWRGRGVAHGLLLAAFAALRDRGQTVARLYVDAQNVTNAVRVYVAAGMHVSRRFDVMEKPLG